MKTTEDQIAREKAAKEKLEETLKKRIKQDAEDKDPFDYTCKVVDLSPNDKTEFVPILDDKVAFKFAVLDPLRNVHNGPTIKDRVILEYDEEDQLRKQFDTLLIKLKFIQAKEFMPTLTPKEGEEIYNLMNKLKVKLAGKDMGLLTEDLEYELDFAIANLIDYLEKRETEQSQYSTPLLKIVIHLEKYWHHINKMKFLVDNKKYEEKPISAYSIGDAYNKEYEETPPTHIDVKYNPAGAFLKRTLKTYFKIDFNNTQLKTLLTKARRIEEAKKEEDSE